MSEGDVSKWAKALLAKIHVITGWVIPQDEMLNILVDQFQKKLSESYENVNPDEIEYAFRNNTSVKDWGKVLNLAMIDEVMIPYLDSRREISHIEAIKKVPMIEHKEDLSDVAMESWLEATAEIVRTGNFHFDLIPNMLYDWLDKKGKIKKTPAEKKEYLERASTYRMNFLVNGMDADSSVEYKKTVATFIAMRNSGVFEGDEPRKIKSIAKSMVLADYIIEQDAINSI